MSTIGKVRAVFTASTSGLVSGVNSAASSMRRLQATTASLRAGMNSLVAIQGAQLFGSIASSAGYYVRSLVNVASHQAEVIDQASKLAARLGMTYGEFAGLALAGDLAGVGMDAIAAAATKADVAFVKAVNGSSQAQAAFASLGLSLEDLGQMSAAERFQAIAQAISELPTEAQQSAAAVAMFGRAGAQLLPLFREGAAGIQRMQEQAQRLGLALTTAQGEDVEAMNDAIQLARKGIEGIVQQVVAHLSPAVKAVADLFTQWIMDKGGKNIGESIGDGIKKGVLYLAQIGDWFIKNLGSVWQYAVSVAQSWLGVFQFGSKIASAFSAAGRLIQTGFLAVVRVALTPMMFIVEQVAELLSYVPGIGGTASVVAATVSGFRDGLDQSIVASAEAASDNIDAMFASAGDTLGQAAAGPLTTAIGAAIAQADASAAQVEEAGKGAAAEVVKAAKAAEPKQQVKGIESRSAEGIAEMFRIMRGGDQNVQQQQLAALQEIAGNTEDMGGIEFDVMELAPGAAN